ncbi:MAG TPA: DUF2807 domain-containing protein [Cyclobacteriaceae bacterium]|nr:DUF2807 domain-containing protein [Cyclobacteriaceae bacterium]
MKKLSFVLFFVFSVGLLTAQDQSDEMPVSTFSKIVASPRVNVILEKGNKESVRILYNQIPKGNVNVKVRGGTLKIYLDHAKVVEKQVRLYGDEKRSGKHGIYEGTSITAYVTYKELKAVEIRGESELRCDSEVKAEKFKVRAYGENEITFAAIHTTKFKASLYGENELKVRGGETDRQVYRLFGENKVLTLGMKSATAATRIYGEGRVRLSATDKVRVNALGEPIIFVEGTSYVSRGIILGRADIRASR